MANYVSNKVICKKEFFERYLLDPNALGKGSFKYCKEHKYIFFNKLFNDVNNVSEYYDKYGEYVDYGHFYTMKELRNDYVEIKFKTRWNYPICAIKKSIEIAHNIVWYATEECLNYMSKFLWQNNKVIEKTLMFDDEDFGEWYEKNVIDGNKYDDLDYADDYVWYYDCKNRKEWYIWDADDLIKKYKDNPSNIIVSLLG